MFAEDFDLFLTDFGTQATLAGGANVTGIFDASSIDILTAASVGPVFLTPSSGISALVYGSPITINSLAYVVRQIEPDGTGMTRLVLERA